MHVPKEIVDVAEFLIDEGFKRAEAYPIEKWRIRKWSEDKNFFDAVDACIKLILAMDKILS